MKMEKIIEKYSPLYNEIATFEDNTLVFSNVKFVGSGESKRIEIAFTDMIITLENEDYTIKYDYIRKDYNVYGSYYYKEKFGENEKNIKLVENIIKDMKNIMEINNWKFEEKLLNEKGVCPKCRHEDLDYDVMEIADDMIYYPYKCNNCGLEGEEWYYLSFNGHSIYDENGDYIELD